VLHHVVTYREVSTPVAAAASTAAAEAGLVAEPDAGAERQNASAVLIL
jgi:hypothetical protein